MKKLPFFFIGKETTENRKDEFKKKKYPVLCENLGKDDTLSIWYTREHISKLLEEIDHAGGNGMKLHFGAYEKGHEFEGQLCLVMNITRLETRSSKTIQVDVLLENELDHKERSVQNRSNQENFVDKTINRDFNFGSPCPPRCHGNVGERKTKSLD